MNLEYIWNKLEDQNPLTTREEKFFSDGMEQGIDKLGQLTEVQALQAQTELGLEPIYEKLEEQEPLTTREEKEFSDGMERSVDKLGRICGV